MDVALAGDDPLLSCANGKSIANWSHFRSSVGEPMSNFAIVVSAISLMVGIAGFSLALLVAFRNRTLVRPRLAFSFRMFEEAYPKLPWRFRRKRPHAIFIYPPKGSFESDLHIPIGVRNNTKRRIEGITLELTYPVAFFLSNQEIQRRTTALVEKFGETLDANHEVAARFVESRNASPLGPSIRVRYDLGALRPGEGFVFAECFALPPREGAFVDGRYAGTAFSNALSHMGASEALRAAFHFTVSIYTDLAPREDREIDIVLCSDECAEDGDDALRAYVDAYWLGALPAGQRFRRKGLTMPWLRKPVWCEMSVDMIRLQREVRVSEPKDGWVAVAVKPDPLASTYGVTTLFLPGYDPRRLSDAVTTPEQGLLSIGFVSAKSVAQADISSRSVGH